jgi:hypothetical protein
MVGLSSCTTSALSTPLIFVPAIVAYTYSCYLHAALSTLFFIVACGTHCADDETCLLLDVLLLHVALPVFMVAFGQVHIYTLVSWLMFFGAGYIYYYYNRNRISEVHAITHVMFAIGGTAMVLASNATELC